jgi:hypothetical protein
VAVGDFEAAMRDPFDENRQREDAVRHPGSIKRGRRDGSKCTEKYRAIVVLGP